MSKIILFLVVLVLVVLNGVSGYELKSGPLVLGTQSVPDGSALLQMNSVTKGMLPPRMTQAERDAIPVPANGLVVFNIDTGRLEYYNGAWVVMGLAGGGFTEGSVFFASPAGIITEDNTNFFWDDTNNYLGLGTNTPSYALDVSGSINYTSLLVTPLTANRVMITDGASVLSASSVTDTELGYVSGVTSAIQTQINSKLDASLTDGQLWVGDATNVPVNRTILGDIAISNVGVSSINAGVIVNADVNASAGITHDKMAALSPQRAMVTDGLGFASNSSVVDNTELDYLDGVTSGIQGQLNGKQTSTLADGNILIGDGSNLATAQAVTGDVTISNAGVTSIASGVIVDGDVNASAAIARSKLASGTADYVLINNGSGFVSEEQYLAKSRGGSAQDNSSLTFPASGTLATLAGAEAFTNKDYDGGTASNSSRLTLPQNTKTNLDGLNRKEGTLVYANDEDTVYVDDGSNLIQIAGGTGDATSVLEDGGFDTTVVSGEKGLTCTVGTCTQETTIVKVGTGSLKIALTAQAGDVKKCYANTGNYWAGKFVEVRAFIKTAITGGKFQLYDDTSVLSEVDIDSSDTFTEHVARGSIPTTGTPKICWRITTPSTTNNLYVDKTFAGDLRVDGTTRVYNEKYVANGASGFGATNTKIPYFTTVSENTVSEVVSISNSATLGFSVTALKKSIVTMSYSIGATAASDIGISKNSSQLTTSITAITASDRLARTTTSSSGFQETVEVNVILDVGDVIRPHTDGVALNAAANMNVTATAYEQSTVVSQSGFTGASIKWTGVTNCSASTTSASYVNMVDTDCTFAGAVKQGTVLTPTTTGGLALKIPYLPAGSYEIGVTGTMNAGNIAGTKCAFRVIDGTNLSAGPWVAFAEGANAQIHTAGGKGVYTYNTPQTNIEFALQSRRDAGTSSCYADAYNDSSSIEISIKPISQDIIGTFPNKVETPQSDGSAKKPVLVSALMTDGVATTTVTEDDSDFINGNCTNGAAGNYTCTFTADFWLSKPHCWFSVNDVAIIPNRQTESTASISFRTFLYTGAAIDPVDVMIFCKGYRK